MGVVLITGASSGIGKDTAKLFAEKGWKVAATMRHPEKETELTKYKNIKMFRCDVTDGNSISEAVKECIYEFGSIDVLVNNAGFYTIGPIESATDEQINCQIDTNLKGTIFMTREVIPYLRKQGHGTIINVSSIAGLISIPMQSLYHATKWGIEGFSESLQYELEDFGIRVKIIEPGVIKTDFYGRSKTITNGANQNEYENKAKMVLGNLINNGNNGSNPYGVAETIFTAASDNSRKIRYRTGASKNMPVLRKVLPISLYMKLVKMNMEK